MKKTSIKKGKLTVICGPMFSGKTKKLVHMVRVFKQNGKGVLVVKPQIDIRYTKEKVIISNDHDRSEAILVDHTRPEQIIHALKKYPIHIDEILIDEINFFEPQEIKKVIKVLNTLGYNVTVSGLDYTYLQEPFGATLDLYKVAKRKMKLFAVCEKCGGKAIYSERISGSLSSKIDVGEKDKYIAVCKNCFEEYK